jgi:hypothetical protein
MIECNIAYVIVFFHFFCNFCIQILKLQRRRKRADPLVPELHLEFLDLYVPTCFERGKLGSSVLHTALDIIYVPTAMKQ